MIRIITNLMLRFYYYKYKINPGIKADYILNVINNFRLLKDKKILDYINILDQIKLIESRPLKP